MENTLGFHGKFANCDHFVLCKLTLLTWIAKTWSMVVTCQNSLSSELVNDIKSKPEKKSREMLVGVDTNWWFVFILQNTSEYCSSNTGMYLDSVKNISLVGKKNTNSHSLNFVSLAHSAPFSNSGYCAGFGKVLREKNGHP